MNEEQVLQATFDALQGKKGDNPVLLDLRNLTIVTDYFLVVGGQNPIHVKALADSVQEKLEEYEVFPQRTEGYKEGRWILLDYGFLVIHILTREERNFYRLEQLWHEAKILTPTLA